MSAAIPGRGLYLVRHGETEANARGVRSGGDCPSPLTSRGRSQMRDLGPRIGALAVRPGVVITSPLRRTLGSAEILNEFLELDLHVEPGFIERGLGAWNGRPVAETAPLFLAGVDPPGGEAGDVFRDRILAAFARQDGHFRNWPLVVTSRGVLRVLLERFGCAVTEVDNGECIRVELAGGEGSRPKRVERLFDDGA